MNARVPVRRQTGASDCGQAVLAMILDYYVVDYSRHQLRLLIGEAAGGTTMETLCTAARACGLEAAGFDAPAHVLGRIPVPAILHLRRGHFVVLEGVDNDAVSIVDPASGRQVVSMAVLRRHYSGCALVLEPVHANHPFSSPRNREQSDEDAAWGVLAPWVRKELSAISRLAAYAVGAVGAICAFAWFAREAVPGAALGTAGAAPSIIGALLSGAAALGATRLCRRIEIVLTQQLSDYLAGRFVQMSARASHVFLASRTSRFLEYLVGDLDPTMNARMPSIRIVRMTLLGLVATVALFAMSTTLGIVLCAILASVVAATIWNARRWQVQATRWRARVQSARELSRAILAAPSDLQAAGAFSNALDTWAVIRRRAQCLVGGSPVMRPEPDVALLGLSFGSLALITGQATIGGRVGPGDGIAAIILGVTTLVSAHAAIAEFQRYRVWTTTLGLLADSEREVPTSKGSSPVDLGPDGGIVLLSSVRFAASGIDSLAETDFRASPGRPVAVIGDDGARAAVARLVLGLVHASAGAVTIDGFTPTELDEPERRVLVKGVLRGAEPMSGTIIANFQMVNPTCNRIDVREACARVGLVDWLDALPLLERTSLSRSLFAGPTARLLCLARLLVRAPRVLVLDGTLDELDIPHAHSILRNLEDLGCTLVLTTARMDIVPTHFRIARVTSSS